MNPHTPAPPPERPTSQPGPIHASRSQLAALIAALDAAYTTSPDTDAHDALEDDHHPEESTP